MNRRREIALQRISRIGSLPAVESVTQTKFKGRPIGSISIEAAINKYMDKKENESQVIEHRDKYIKTSNNQQQQTSDMIVGQMSEYMSMLEECRHVNIRRGKDIEESAANIKTKKIYSGYYEKPEAEPGKYDNLDANRCPAFLLYSYDKNGVHSTLGEDEHSVKNYV